MKSCPHCNYKDVPDLARFCPMCGHKQEGASKSKTEYSDDEDLEPTREIEAIPDAVHETLRDRKTEVLSQAVIQEKLDQIRDSISEPEARATAASPKPVKQDSKRRFSETMWFMTGLDSDQLVEDSDEDVASDKLQDRYEKKPAMGTGIREQFTLSESMVDDTSKDERADS